MFGASGKLGRGGGSGGKRNVQAKPNINRSATAGRLSMGGGPRGRGGASISSPSTSSLQAEESFSLVRENPLNFAMAIKLAPDLVEEIKRVEAEGGTARIKFDANAKNTNGNVIHVGDKLFKFTWSREPGDLCDIYEERRSAEDGSGLLVESGGTWRKLNVERELDESTKNHVKMRSEEAERKHKSRKAIILDHQNTNMKNQMKALAASESAPWRNFKHKKEPPFKKTKLEAPSAGGPPKPAYKSGLITKTPPKGRFSSSSPLSVRPEYHGASTSPIGSGSLVKGNTIVPDVTPTKNTSKASSAHKEMQGSLPGNTVREKPNHNRNTDGVPADLRSLIVSLLVEHQSNGISKQSLEKAVGDAMPNSARQIDPILKQLAIIKTPGRYFLKPGVDMENFKEPPSQSGSSPEMNHHQSSASQKFDQLPLQDPFSMKTAANDGEQDQLNSMLGHTVDTVEKIDILNDSPENLSDKNIPENIKVIAGSSDSGSDSDSESDSDSSDSESDSGSHSKSKSRSPVGSRGGSSSDSESDASSSSKQASDEEVDIMSGDDDIESKHKSFPSKSPVEWRHQDNESVDIGNYEKHDDHDSDIVEIEKDSPEGNYESERDGNSLFHDKEGEDPVQEIERSSDYTENQERQVGDRKPYNGADSVVSERLLKGKSKSHSEDNNSEERNHNRKKLKSRDLSQPVFGTINSLFGESPDNSSPDRPRPDDGPINLMVDRKDTSDPNLQIGFHQVSPTRATSDSQQPGQRSIEAIRWGDAPSGEKRPGRHDSLGRDDKYPEKSVQSNEGLCLMKGFDKDAQSENGLVSERRPTKFSADNRKYEMSGKLKDSVPRSNSFMDNNTTSTTNRSAMINGLGRVLQREHSDLELGEFREPSNDETPAPKKRFERKSSFKQLENKPTDSENWNTDLNIGKPANKITADLGKITPPGTEAAVGPSKRKVQEHYADDFTRPHQKTTRPIEVISQQNKVPEMISKGRGAEAGTGGGANLEMYGNTSRKVHVNSTEQQHDTIRGVAKESKKQKHNVVGDSNGRRKDASLTGSNNGSQKRRESSPDENSCSYTKYEKEEPELKGPIKNTAQYKEYVKEYQEKYESYCSLNKVLESYRDEFSNLGKDLESYKGKDMKRYNDILGQLRSSFRQSGERHTRLKKIFIVLYEELKHLKQMIKDYAASYKKD